MKIQPILREENFTAPGELEFTFRARRPTDRVTVNARDLVIDPASVSVEEVRNPSVLGQPNPESKAKTKTRRGKNSKGSLKFPPKFRIDLSKTF